ncbi:Unknown protein sequence [Pseudomonas syringae pv. maculicola]|nr:Unknown protein sequence [Pseudomonas syringae pv. maculicola]
MYLHDVAGKVIDDGQLFLRAKAVRSFPEELHDSTDEHAVFRCA